MTTEEFAKDLLLKGYNAKFKGGDLSALIYLKYRHDEDFRSWCRERQGNIGNDDDMDNDLHWLGKALLFFVERGYIKN